MDEGGRAGARARAGEGILAAYSRVPGGPVVHSDIVWETCLQLAGLATTYRTCSRAAKEAPQLQPWHTSNTPHPPRPLPKKQCTAINVPFCVCCPPLLPTIKPTPPSLDPQDFQLQLRANFGAVLGGAAGVQRVLRVLLQSLLRPFRAERMAHPRHHAGDQLLHFVEGGRGGRVVPECSGVTMSAKTKCENNARCIYRTVCCSPRGFSRWRWRYRRVGRWCQQMSRGLRGERGGTGARSVSADAHITRLR